ncbi:MAG: DNA polymerase III subunit epsilon, partial [Rubrivivax sp.]|nr:DNA polymerase III subunit epsilon [Rubrivivax sp.]
MRRDRRLLAALAAAALATALLLAGWALASSALVGSTLTAGEKQALQDLLGPRLPLLVLAAVMVIGAVLAGVPALYRRWLAAPARLYEQTQVLLTTGTEREIEPIGSAPVQGLARAINQLARERAELRGDVARQVAEGSRNLEQERNRLAALMSELTQSVVVCNLDGRILLYNNRARLQFRALAGSPEVGASALIGLGRSIYTVFDRQLVAHALDSIRQRLLRGAAHPSAQFVTATRGGQLLRVQMAPVRAPQAELDAPLSGFVLMLDNITRDLADDTARDRLLHKLSEGHRSSLGNLQAAVEL